MGKDRSEGSARESKGIIIKTMVQESTMKWAMTALVAVVLAGCALAGPQRISATQPTVSYSYQGDKLDEANAKANDYCNTYRLTAKLIDVESRATDKVARFECI